MTTPLPATAARDELDRLKRMADQAGITEGA
jgi:hypothetical protein